MELFAEHSPMAVHIIDALGRSCPFYAIHWPTRTQMSKLLFCSIFSAMDVTRMLRMAMVAHLSGMPQRQDTMRQPVCCFVEPSWGLSAAASPFFSSTSKEWRDMVLGFSDGQRRAHKNR